MKKIVVRKYNDTSVEVGFIEKGRGYLRTTVSLNLIKGLNPTYIMFVLRFTGAVTTNDKKNSRYAVRKRLFIDAQRKTTADV